MIGRENILGYDERNGTPDLLISDGFNPVTAMAALISPKWVCEIQ